MTKLDFVTKQLDKTRKKRYEQLVVHRIWNKLDDLRIKFITQQFVRRPNGRAMTDMYFPQLGIHVEVDEGHHKDQLVADKMREADIIDATGHRILRVDVTQEIERIHEACDQIAKDICNEIASNTDFAPWDLEAEMNPQTYVEKGYIDVGDDAAFKTMVDAANCFGLNIRPKGIWTGGARHPLEANTLIWFPKLYQNDDWDNQMSEDEQTITEVSSDSEKFKKHFDRVMRENEFTRIVFPRLKGPLGDFMYRFKGKFQLDISETNFENGFVWRRTDTRVKTYPNRDLASIYEENPYKSFKGINFVVDEDGNKVAVMIDLEEYGDVWEDFYAALTEDTN